MKRLLGLYFVFLLICPMAHASSVLDANTFASCPLCYEDKLTGQKSINAFWGSTQNGLRIAIQLTLFCDDERTPMAPEMRVFAAEAGAAPFEVASLQIFIDDHVYTAANLYAREESAYFFCELGPHGRSMLNRLASAQAITLHLSCRDERGKPFFLQTAPLPSEAFQEFIVFHTFLTDSGFGDALSAFSFAENDYAVDWR